MPKAKMEIQSIEHIPWKLVEEGGITGKGIYERILSMDPETGNYTRLLKVEAGVETTETIAHDFWEEIWVLKAPRRLQIPSRTWLTQ